MTSTTTRATQPLTPKLVATNVDRVAPRLTAGERREQLLEVASKLFAQHGYRNTTTAQIAAAATVTEPTIYRHFPGKRELYMACVVGAWENVREQMVAAVDAEPDPAGWTGALSTIGLATLRSDGRVQLWLQLHGEAPGDAEIRAFAAANLREVHEFLRDVIARAQAAGGVTAAADPDVEAWMLVAVALLGATAARVGLGSAVDLGGIARARQAGLAPDA